MTKAEQAAKHTAYMRRYRATRVEQFRAYNSAYHLAHRQSICAKMRERARIFRITHPKLKAASDAASYRRHKGAINARCRAYYLTHKDQMKSANKARYLAQREARLAKAVIYSRANRARISAYLRQWVKANPDRVRLISNRRRANKAGNGGSHTIQEWADRCASFRDVCAYCGEAKPLTRDHVIPLSRGGSDDISNIVPACKSCNSRKQTRTAAEYLCDAAC